MERFFIAPHKFSPEYTLVEEYQYQTGVVQVSGSPHGVHVTVGSALPVLLQGEHIVIFSGCESVKMEAAKLYV